MFDQTNQDNQQFEIDDYLNLEDINMNLVKGQSIEFRNQLNWWEQVKFEEQQQQNVFGEEQNQESRFQGNIFNEQQFNFSFLQERKNSFYSFQNEVLNQQDQVESLNQQQNQQTRQIVEDQLQQEEQSGSSTFIDLEKVQIKKDPFQIIKDSKKKIEVQTKLKNECKYITLVVISALKKSFFYETLLEFADQDEEIAQETIKQFTNKKQLIGGFQKLKEEILPKQDDDEEDFKVKETFRQFMVWFLENRYIRYIIKKGKMSESIRYLNYKNQVMLKHLKNPSLWNTNTMIKKKIAKKD